MKSILIAAVLAAGVSLVWAQQAADNGTPQRFDYRVRTYFFAGFGGDAESLAKGMKICEATLAADPKNADAMVWHGAGLFYESGQFFQQGDQQKGIDFWQRGIAEMDRAVELAPDDLGVRIPRGAALLTGSRFAPKEMQAPLVERALSDYQKAYAMQSAGLDTMPSHPKGELLIGLAEAYLRTGSDEKAAATYAELETAMPGTVYGKKAAAYRETKTVQTGCLGCHTAK